MTLALIVTARANGPGLLPNLCAASNRVNRLTPHLHSARTSVHSASASSFCIKFSKFSLTVPDPFYSMYGVFGSGMAASCKDTRCGFLVEPGFYGRVITTN
jgi:hypothetical protein